jgi:hypothetical protein
VSNICDRHAAQTFLRKLMKQNRRSGELVRALWPSGEEHRRLQRVTPDAKRCSVQVY